MPLQLLPASAQAYAPRSAPTVVLSSQVEPWLTQALKRVNRTKRPLNSTPQHSRCLTELLGGPQAIWTLASLMLPKQPDSQLCKDSDPLVQAVSNYQLVHVEAYVVHVDMVSQHEVAFKLTTQTIEALVNYHRDIYVVDAAASTYDWPEKESQVRKMHEDFVHAANRFVFRTAVQALEGLEEDGAGELLTGCADDVKAALMNLFLPLLPPPPRIVDVANSTAFWPGVSDWAWPVMPLATPDSWKVLPSTPSPAPTGCSDATGSGLRLDFRLNNAQLPSPAPSFGQPFPIASQHYFDSPLSASPLSCGSDVLLNSSFDVAWSPLSTQCPTLV
ncbi:hypothetical protein K470DRAFT_264158 [Piedraia hortae CBS 480.64]|uniref:Uncharacterized protein n=1 Tax=Piedraia hortae CBS 480.64 TaxID=1314780 RepID=A0A6A7BZW2_9PEZI|nr:hypothetical protein K470DRAFT_264158 [Piedraia hortae CBS 480.64]